MSVQVFPESLFRSGRNMHKVGAVFGVVWVVLVIASGMLANIGLSHAISMMVVSTGKAYDLWVLISVIVEGLGGGNEIVGGLWVLLMSLAGLKAKVFSRGLNYIGLVVGVFGIATIYPAEVFTEIFGVSQVIWFVWLGTSLLRQSNATNAVQPVANGGRIKSL